MHLHDNPNGIPHKACCQCGDSKPATAEFFHRDKGRKDGLCARCKECACGNTRQWYESNKERRAEYNNVNRERLNGYARQWNAANSKARNEYQRKWRAANRDAYNEYQRRHNKKRDRKEYYATYSKLRQEDPAYRERRAEYMRAYEARRKGKRDHKTYRLAHKEQRAAIAKTWRAANRERVRMYSRRRRALKAQAEGTHTAADIQAQYKRQKGCCYWCGVKVGDSYHVDHIVPLSRGGTDWPENLVVACQPCNQSKFNKLPHEWAEGGRLI